MRKLHSAVAALLVGASAGVFAAPALAQQQTPCPPATAGIAVGARPPPPLPVYEQPPMPAYGYVWTPGYWGWNTAVNDYYWNPGIWVQPPRLGVLWTPGYWGWNDGVYIFNAGYWGPHVGFYGGINYGFGYGGFGYEGGYWRGGTFFYNRYANNFGGVHVNAVYNGRAENGRLGSRASFNGGPGGVNARASAAELAAAREGHIGPTSAQSAASQRAAFDRGSRAGVNNGHPLLAAAAGAAAGAALVHGTHALVASHGSHLTTAARGAHSLTAGHGAVGGGHGTLARSSTLGGHGASHEGAGFAERREDSRFAGGRGASTARNERSSGGHSGEGRPSGGGGFGGGGFREHEFRGGAPAGGGGHGGSGARNERSSGGAGGGHGGGGGHPSGGGKGPRH
jgi:hypothetical protein